MGNEFAMHESVPGESGHDYTQILVMNPLALLGFPSSRRDCRREWRDWWPCYGYTNDTILKWRMCQIWTLFYVEHQAQTYNEASHD